MHIFIRLYLLISWAGAIFILIAWPTAEYNGTVVTYYDKVAHVILFGVFSYLLFFVLLWFKKLKIFYIILLSAVFGLLYSAFCEFVQLYVPGRDAHEYDLYAGIIGIIIAQIIAYVRFKKSKT